MQNEIIIQELIKKLIEGLDHFATSESGLTDEAQLYVEDMEYCSYEFAHETDALSVGGLRNMLSVLEALNASE